MDVLKRQVRKRTGMFILRGRQVYQVWIIDKDVMHWRNRHEKAPPVHGASPLKNRKGKEKRKKGEKKKKKRKAL
jgi:hypothetical protein